MKKVLYLLVGALPLVAGAQVFNGFSNIQNALASFGSILNAIIPIIIGLAVVTFLWGVLKYVVTKEEEQKKEARDVMLYGIIAIFVMISVWGLVRVLGSTLNLNNAAPQGNEIPTIPNTR